MISVSIIIPVHNLEKEITRCILSVCDQSYKGNIECIVVDDGSTDASILIIKQLIATYNGKISFQLISYQENKGVSEARNIGISKSKSKYLFFLDGDDIITPDCIESLVLLAEKYNYPDMIIGSFHVTNFQYTWMNLKNKNLPEYSADPTWIKETLLERFTIPVVMMNKLISASFIKTNNLWFHKGIIHEDEHWNFFAAKHIKTIAISSNKETYHYITNPNSIMNITSPIKSHQSWSIILNDCINNIDPFCKRAQMNYIFILLYIKYFRDLDSNKDLHKTFRSLFIKFSNIPQKNFISSLLYRFFIYSLLFIPIPFARKYRTYRFLFRIHNKFQHL